MYWLGLAEWPLLWNFGKVFQLSWDNIKLWVWTFFFWNHWNLRHLPQSPKQQNWGRSIFFRETVQVTTPQDGWGWKWVQRAGDRADHQGVHHWREEEGCVHLLPGVLHGPLPPRWCLLPTSYLQYCTWWPLYLDFILTSISFQSWRPSPWRSPQLTWRGHLLTSGSPKIVQQTLLEYYKINSPDMDPVVGWNILY